MTHLLISADYSLFDLWQKYGLDSTHDLNIRLKVLHQWISILYDKDIDLDVIVMKMRVERSEAYQAVSKAGGCLLQGDIVEGLIRYELDLSD